MNVTVTDRQPDVSAQSQVGLVDCDVHPYTKSPADLDQFLSEKWRKHRQTIGNRARSPFGAAPNYPRMSPGTGMRHDAWPKDGSHPGSDLPLMREQLLDAFGVSYGMMMPLLGRGATNATWNSARRCARRRMTGKRRYGAMPNPA